MFKSLWKTLFKKPLERLGYVNKADIDKQLNFGGSVAKRLDEHREMIEGITDKTDLLENQPWNISHLTTQDDYLMRLFYIVHGTYPDTLTADDRRFGYVRKRPEILSDSGLNDYFQEEHAEVILQISKGAGGE